MISVWRSVSLNAFLNGFWGVVGVCLWVGLSGCAADPLDSPTLEGADPEDPSLQSSTDAILVERETEVKATGRLRITMVDVGQGDGLLVELPSGKKLAIDGGPSSSRYTDYLESRGISRLDFAILSHAHDDHYTGLTAAMDYLPDDCVYRVTDPGYNRSTIAGYRTFRDTAGCRYRAMGLGQTLNLDPAVQLEVISVSNKPYPPSSDSHGINNTSVVVRLRYRNFSMLFSGDAEAEAEESQLMRLGTRLRSTVLKVGHHGSCTATTQDYLSAVSPKTLLISVAGGNGYGLPHCQTMDKFRPLRARGARWYRTDENGHIVLSTDGYRYYVAPQRAGYNVDRCPRDCADPSET